MLTLQFIPYVEIENLSSEKRVSKLLNVVKEDKIVVLEGRLKKEEEANLIKQTMECIDDEFKGIELSVIYPDVRNKLTIIGPASIEKEKKKDPKKIELLTMPLRAKKKKK